MHEAKRKNVEGLPAPERFRYFVRRIAGYQPKAILLSDFVSKWMPGMTNDQVSVGVFPTRSDRGVVVEPQSLADALVKEATQYE